MHEIKLGRHIDNLTLDNKVLMEELAKVKRELYTVKEELAKVSEVKKALPKMNW